jgi:glycosyltransferase domain-containing protein
MPRLVIPTRNRPASLAAVLRFTAANFPGTRVVVADGSAARYQPENRAAAQQAEQRLAVDYRAFDAELPYFDRVLQVLTSLDDEVLVMGADDDYPQMDVLAEAEKFLLSHPDYVSALGGRISFNLKQADSLFVRMDHAHAVTAASAAERVTAFAAWPFSTTYAATRRTHLIERYERAKGSFFASFYDYIIGVQDALAGKIGVVPGFSYVCTKNYRHSYLRPEDRLAFLRNSAQVLKVREELTADLKLDGMNPREAEHLATELIGRRIAALVGDRPQRQPGFEKSAAYRDPAVQRQIRDFHALFSGSGALRETMGTRLRAIVDEVTKVSSSADNAGEAASYETFEAQAAGGKDVARRRDAPHAGRPRSLPARTLGQLRRLLGREGGSRLRFEVSLDTLLRKPPRAS